MHYQVWPRDEVYLYKPYCGPLTNFHDAESEYLTDAVKIAEDLTLQEGEWNVYDQWSGRLVWGVNKFDYRMCS